MAMDPLYEYALSFNEPQGAPRMRTGTGTAMDAFPHVMNDLGRPAQGPTVLPPLPGTTTQQVVPAMPGLPTFIDPTVGFERNLGVMDGRKVEEEEEPLPYASEEPDSGVVLGGPGSVAEEAFNSNITGTEPAPEVMPSESGVSTGELEPLPDPDQPGILGKHLGKYRDPIVDALRGLEGATQYDNPLEAFAGGFGKSGAAKQEREDRKRALVMTNEERAIRKEKLEREREEYAYNKGRRGKGKWQYRDGMLINEETGETKPADGADNPLRGPGGQKAPQGYQWTRDENGQWSQNFIPGGPADPAVKAAGRKGGKILDPKRQQALKQRTADDLDRLSGKIKGLMKNPDLPKAFGWSQAVREGIGKLGERVGIGEGGAFEMSGTSYNAVRTEIDSIAAQLKLITLQSMKDASANGASGLGAVTKPEFDALSDQIAAIGKASTDAQAMELLQRALDYSNQLKGRLYEDDVPTSSGEAPLGEDDGEEPPVSNTPMPMPDGAETFDGPDGRAYFFDEESRSLVPVEE